MENGAWELLVNAVEQNLNGCIILNVFFVTLNLKP